MRGTSEIDPYVASRRAAARRGARWAFVLAALAALAAALFLAVACVGVTRDLERDLHSARVVVEANVEAVKADPALCADQQAEVARLLRALEKRAENEQGFSAWVRGFVRGVKGGE